MSHVEMLRAALTTAAHRCYEVSAPLGDLSHRLAALYHEVSATVGGAESRDAQSALAAVAAAGQTCDPLAGLYGQVGDQLMQLAATL